MGSTDQQLADKVLRVSGEYRSGPGVRAGFVICDVWDGAVAMLRVTGHCPGLSRGFG